MKELRISVCLLLYLSVHFLLLDAQFFNSASLGRVAPVGVISNFGFNGQREVLSSLGGAKVGVYRRTQQQQSPIYVVPQPLPYPVRQYNYAPIARPYVAPVRSYVAPARSYVVPAKPYVAPARPYVVPARPYVAPARPPVKLSPGKSYRPVRQPPPAKKPSVSGRGGGLLGGLLGGSLLGGLLG